MVAVGKVDDHDAVVAREGYDVIALLEVDRKERERDLPDVAEARGGDVAPAPEDLFEPARRLDADHPLHWQRQGHDRERIVHLRRPRNLDVTARAELRRSRANERDVRRDDLELLAEVRRADERAVAHAQAQTAGAERFQ